MRAERIVCRSRLTTECAHGQDSDSIYECEGMDDDGTFNGTSVICDACYIALGTPLRAHESFRTGKPAGVSS